MKRRASGGNLLKDEIGRSTFGIRMTRMSGIRFDMRAVTNFRRVDKQVAGIAYSRTGLVLCPVMIQRGPGIVTKSAVRPGAYLLEFRFAAIQPYGNGTQRCGTGDDQVCLMVIVDVACLKTETSFAFSPVDGELQPRAATRKMDADLVNGSVLVDRGSFRYVVAIKIMADRRTVGDTFGSSFGPVRTEKNE